MKSLLWLTADYFIDVDLPIINQLNQVYKIKWIIIISQNEKIDYEDFVHKSLTNKSISLEFIYLKHRYRSLKILLTYYKIIKRAKLYRPNIYYLSFLGMPYALFLYKLLLPINKCIIPCHNVTTPKGAKNEKIAAVYTHLWLSTFKNIQVFSYNQYQILTEKYSNKNVLYAPLALKDYGEPQIKIDKLNALPIRFLFFGNIVEYKRLDILINAANLLAKRGLNFKVRIAGACKNWEKYRTLIKYPEVFELQIKRIPNEEVADLFSDSHYFVMPYQDIAQSGAITVAFRYNLPVICSDIKQFQEFIENNKTGFTFRNEDVTDLADKMTWLINSHRTIYQTICNNEKSFVEKNFSLNAIAQKYIEYINSLPS